MSSTGSPPFAFSRATATPQSKSTSTRESHSTGNVRPLPHRLLVAPPLQLSLPPRLCRALRMYTACPCPHAIQLLQVATNAPRQRQALLPLHQRVSWPRGYVKRSRGIGSCIRVLAQKSCMSLTAKTTAHPAQDSLRLMTHSRRGNARILLVCFPHHLLNRVPGRPYLAHATAAQLLSRKSAALSVPALVHGIPARALAQEAVEVHDTIPMSPCPAHH